MLEPSTLGSPRAPRQIESFGLRTAAPLSDEELDCMQAPRPTLFQRVAAPVHAAEAFGARTTHRMMGRRNDTGLVRGGGEACAACGVCGCLGFWLCTLATAAPLITFGIIDLVKSQNNKQAPDYNHELNKGIGLLVAGIFGSWIGGLIGAGILGGAGAIMGSSIR